MKKVDEQGEFTRRTILAATTTALTAMKYLIPVLLVGGCIALTVTEASAVVCAVGVYRAGCVAARPVVVAPRAVVVAPRPVIVAPVRRRVY
jgi:hypothetical protein